MTASAHRGRAPGARPPRRAGGGGPGRARLLGAARPGRCGPPAARGGLVGVGAAFALRRPLYRGRSIVLNAATRVDGDGSRVNLLCQTTNITRPGAPDGPHILLATRVTTGGGGG